MPDRLTRKSFLPGAQIFREGEPGDEAYIIVSGEVEISALQRGRKIIIDKLGEEELFGEMALIDDEVRSATATTTVDTEVIVIERAHLRDKIDELLRIISEAGLENSDIKLEITESLMVDDPDHAAIAFCKLKDEKVRLAIDDFGTGYSSLSYLNRYPLDTLKIDRSFVANMLQDQSSLDIVRGVASLASDLGMDIIAEGIESTDEITQLRDFGCSYGQGYLISHPVPFDAASELLKTRLSW